MSNDSRSFNDSGVLDFVESPLMCIYLLVISLLLKIFKKINEDLGNFYRKPIFASGLYWTKAKIYPQIIPHNPDRRTKLGCKANSQGFGQYQTIKQCWTQYLCPCGSRKKYKKCSERGEGLHCPTVSIALWWSICSGMMTMICTACSWQHRIPRTM
jgi:hypothetical protein